MMQIFRISVLWLAGLLIIGHGIIPHHRHHVPHECEATDHEHQTIEAYAVDCSCDLPDEEEKCHFQQNTLLDGGKLLSLAINPVIESIVPVFPGKSLWVEYPNLFRDSKYYKKKPSRAPPVC